MKKFNGIYEGKTVLVTGHTGFKGSWLCIWLLELGATVIGYSLDPYTKNDNFVLAKLSNRLVDIRGDICDKQKLEEVFSTYKPDIVFHLAAQPLVLESYRDPVHTYDVNVMGTINVLESIRKTNETRVGIFITTDKCYENKESLWPYRESDAMGGYDPYSSSKGACELVINSWRQSYFHPKSYETHQTSIASVRAGNVIGGGDWSMHRIVPDCIKSIEANEPIILRHPQAIRPWQHVLEPLSGYLLLGEKLLTHPKDYCEGWNFGPNVKDVKTVRELTDLLVKRYKKGTIVEQVDETWHEANLLLLDITKAQLKLGWTPTLDVSQCIDLTCEWYQQYQSADIYALCVQQIEKFSLLGV